MRRTVTAPKPRWVLPEGTTVEPQNNRVIVRRCEPQDHAGLVLMNPEKHHWGEVLAKGPGKKRKYGYESIDFNVGDMVLLGHYDDYPELAEGVIMVREGDILAVADGA